MFSSFLHFNIVILDLDPTNFVHVICHTSKAEIALGFAGSVPYIASSSCTFPPGLKREIINGTWEREIQVPLKVNSFPGICFDAGYAALHCID